MSSQQGESAFASFHVAWMLFVAAMVLQVADLQFPFLAIRNIIVHF
jgi:hypothetical protein